MSAAGTSGSLRIVVFTDMPQIMAVYSQMLVGMGHQIVGVVTARKRAFGYLEVVSNAPATADVLVSNHPRRWAAMLAPLRPDVIFTTVFPLRLPQDVIDLPRFGTINMHPSVLPKYRGTNTPNWTFLNGEETAGLTIHRMVADFDAGPILAQTSVEIEDDDDLSTLTQRLFAHAPALIATALGRIVAGDPGDPQDESQATYFGVIPDEQRVIDWNSPARRVHNQVRAFGAFFSPPGAFATIDGVPSRITRSRLIAGDAPIADIEPGTVIERGEEGLTIQCGDGPIRVLEFEPA